MKWIRNRNRRNAEDPTGFIIDVSPAELDDFLAHPDKRAEFVWSNEAQEPEQVK